MQVRNYKYLQHFFQKNRKEDALSGADGVRNFYFLNKTKKLITIESLKNEDIRNAREKELGDVYSRGIAFSTVCYNRGRERILKI